MRSSGRGIILLSCAVSVGVATTVVACSDEGGTSVACPPGSDASTTKPPVTVPSDGGSAGDAPSETGPGDATGPVDAGHDVVTDTDARSDAEASAPVFTTVVETSGQISMTEYLVSARFLQDDQVVRMSGLPECVTYISATSKPASNIGQLSVSTGFFGQDGGPPGTQIDIDPNSRNNYFTDLAGPPFFYPRTGAVDVQLRGAGTPQVTALPQQTLKSPAFEQIRVTAPAKLDGGIINVDTRQDLTVRWDVPDASAAGQKMIVSLPNMDDDSHIIAIRCGFPLAAGQAVIPAALLTYVRSRLGTLTTTPTITILAGDQRDVHVAGVTYEIEVSRDDSTDFSGADVNLQ